MNVGSCTRAWLCCLLGLTIASGVLAGQGEEDRTRQAAWATPLAGYPGVPNLHKVSEQLYRGAQPTDEGFAQLAELGIKTVVNLRTFHSDRRACRRYGLGYVHITFQAWEGEDDEVVEFLKVVTDRSNQPVFVHCQHGADRTGVMAAVYRLAVQGWSREAALDEMVNGGYGFHAVWQNLVDYVRTLQLDRLIELAGTASPSSNPD